jgi:branched-chain amino acid transport system substrate-binding protein
MVHAAYTPRCCIISRPVEALKSDDGTKVVAKMKEMPTDDPLFGKGTIRDRRPQDPPGVPREVKKPSESKGPWDYYKVRATIPATRPSVR